MSAAPAILLVEDSATQALQLRHAMEDSGLRVTWVESAEAALEALHRAPPDLLVSDYRLPGIHGDELCRKIRMNIAMRSLPILLLTGEGDANVERHVLESGADDYIAKSQDTELVLLRIQALLRKSKRLQLGFADPDAFAPARLLVVDDSRTYQELLAAELGGDGYAIRQAKSGGEALQQLALEAFDGVVLDLGLPDMSGVDLCARLVEARRTLDRSYVLFALTASATRENVTSLLAAGADDVVEKSRDMAVIKARLRALIRRKRLHEENERIAAEFRRRELELLRATAEKEAAQARAALAERLEQANRELKEAQAQLVQSAKMASLGQLVAGIAHEINNPLSFVLSHHGTVERALAELADEVAPALAEPARARWVKAQRRLADIREGLERIGELVLKLRTFSRLDEGEHKYVKIEESIESVLTLLQHRMRSRITVHRRYGPVKVVPCYPGPLNQVLMNIVANAIDAIPGEGEITLATGEEDGMFTVSVADTGEGIAEEARERIFDPFFTTKPVGQGTGLGLSISYGIVRRHGGAIEVKSERGKGTEMIVRIPLHPKRTREEEQ